MFSNFIKTFFVTIFIFSKEILVFNEESLVVLAFIIFIYLVLVNANLLVISTLNEKSSTIQNKFDIYQNIQEKTILYLLDFYGKQGLLSKKLKKISTNKKLHFNIVRYYYKINAKKKLVLRIGAVLNKFILNEIKFNTLFQKIFMKTLISLETKFIVENNTIF